jgi:hypothetical protein
MLNTEPSRRDKGSTGLQIFRLSSAASVASCVFGESNGVFENVLAVRPPRAIGGVFKVTIEGWTTESGPEPLRLFALICG